MKFRGASFISLVLLLVLAAGAPVWAQKSAASRPAHSAGGAFASSVPLRPTGRPVARVNGAALTDRDLLRELLPVADVQPVAAAADPGQAAGRGPAVR